MRTLLLVFALLAPGCVSIPTPSEVEDADESLTLAGEALSRGDDTTAATHFESYIGKHPDQLMFRLYLADLLFKLQRLPEARLHYERFVADAESAPGSPKNNLVHCRTRLMEIAQHSGDRFAELLHRGIGLALLAKVSREAESAEPSAMREEILCTAIQTLREAARLKPHDPRVQVYLAEAYDRAGNRAAAATARAAARNNALPGDLTPTEHLQLAEE
jgi:predicted Zn-dependent protease